MSLPILAHLVCDTAAELGDKTIITFVDTPRDGSFREPTRSYAQFLQRGQQLAAWLNSKPNDRAAITQRQHGERTMQPTTLTQLAVRIMTFAVAGTLAAASAALAQAPAAAPAAQAPQTAAALPSAEQLSRIAEEAYVYGLPLVQEYAVMYAFAVDATNPQYKAPFNQLVSVGKPLTPADRTIPYGNNDTLYSLGWLDLRTEPLVVSVPAMEKDRYYSAVFSDASSLNYGQFGSRSTGTGAGSFMIVGPDWQGKTPPGIKAVLRSPSPLSMVLIRTELRAGTDIERVHAIQAGYKLQPLSGFLGQKTPAAAPAIDFPKIDREAAQKNFFFYLDFAMRNLSPAQPEERELRERLASIGLGNGEFARFQGIAGQMREALLTGVQAGQKKLAAHIAGSGPRVNGWNWKLTLDVNQDSYRGDILKRAALVKEAPHGLNIDEAIYPIVATLPGGDKLDGSQHDYRLTFAANDLPPVGAFWSITMYDAATGAFIDNPINRYAINSQMLPTLKRNADGSLSLLIQKDAPDADWQTNWLPAPNGPLSLVLRLYAPSEKAQRGEWTIPPVELMR